jgi:hypothetical protein
MNGGIRWVALKEGRDSVNGGRYDWAEAFGKGNYEKWGGEDCNFFVGYFFGFGVWFWRLGELL